MNPFRTTRRVEFADTDMACIVHFSNFFRYMEAAEVDFLQARGLSVSMPFEGQRVGFPRVAASCDYLKPARFLDVLGGPQGTQTKPLCAVSNRNRLRWITGNTEGPRFVSMSRMWQ